MLLMTSVKLHFAIYHQFDVCCSEGDSGGILNVLSANITMYQIYITDTWINLGEGH